MQALGVGKPPMTELKITADAMIPRGPANGPAPIVERRLDGRLLVAVPSKRNVWLVLDGAFVPAPLAKRIPSHSKAVEERIVVPVEHRDDVIALVEAWVVGGGKEQDAKRAASAANAAATRKAKAGAKAAAEREVARVEAQAKAAEEAAARRAAAEAARPALIEACKAIAAGAVSYSTYPGFDGEFVVRTQYDPRVVDVLRTIPGARWDEARRVWIVPARSHAALAPHVVSINAWAEQTRAAEAEAARIAEEERRAKRRELDARRYLVLADRAPSIGKTLREGDRVVTVESLGKIFRSSDDDGMLDPWMEGELVRYAYHRAPTAEELAALEARETRMRPAMVAQPVQQAQARATPVAVFAARAKIAAIKAEGVNIIDDVRVRRVEAEAAHRAWMDCLNHGRPSHDAQARSSEASRLVDITLEALWDRGGKAPSGGDGRAPRGRTRDGPPARPAAGMRVRHGPLRRSCAQGRIQGHRPHDHCGLRDLRPPRVGRD